jgi:uncharacterized protein (TIGR02145 family)
LENYLDPAVIDPNTTGYRGTDVGGKLKAVSSFWTSPNTGANNSSGFSALPGGYRYSNGEFYGIGSIGYWWSSTEYSWASAWVRGLGYNYGGSKRSSDYRQAGFSVRCLRD